MSLIHDKKHHQFESGSDFSTLLTFMAGYAIRERTARIQEQKKAGSLADSSNKDDEALIRDFAKVIALCEAESDEDVEAIRAALVERFKNLKL